MLLLFFFISGIYASIQFKQAGGFSLINIDNPFTSSSQVEGVDYYSRQEPSLYLSAPKDGGWSAGGVIPLTSQEEPAITISGDVSGEGEISVYSASIDNVLEYLLHDKDYKQVRPKIDVSKFSWIATFPQRIGTKSESGEYHALDETKVVLPIGKTGIFYVRVNVGNVVTEGYVIRTSIGSLVKEGDSQFVFWSQSFENWKSLTQGQVKIYSLLNERKELVSTSIDQQGLSKTNIFPNADIALIQSGNETALLPMNMKYLNTGYNYEQFRAKQKVGKFFIFTDRPVYKPGDKVFYKIIARDDNDGIYAVPKESLKVMINDNYDNKTPLLEKNTQVSTDGAVYGEYQIPKEQKAGSHSISVQYLNSGENNYAAQSTSYFEVEHYRKPEYFIEANTDRAQYVSGDKIKVTISGNYFSGQPLSNQIVKYNVYVGDFYDYQLYSDKPTTIDDSYRYGYVGGETVAVSTVQLDGQGKAIFEIDAKNPKATGLNEVYSIEAEYDNGSGNPSFSRKNVLVYAGEYNIYRKDDTGYYAKVNQQISLPVVVVATDKAAISGTNLTVKVKRKAWFTVQEENKKNPTYKEEEEGFSDLTATTDGSGNAVFSFTPIKSGSYYFTVEGKDKRGNLINKEFYSWVSDTNVPTYFDTEAVGLSIRSDKSSYKPGETAKLTITSEQAGRDIFLAMQRDRLHRYQIVHMDGKVTTVDVPLIETDMPNIFAYVTSFSSRYMDYASTDVVVSPKQKEMKITVTTNQKTYTPGDTVIADIKTTDNSGKPISADTALWVVDKSIFELAEESNGSIFDTFWSKRGENTAETNSLMGIHVFENGGMGGGCFIEGTPVLMADGSEKPIEQIKPGDYVATRTSESDNNLVKGKVTSTHKAAEIMVLIINGSLKVTTNHRMWVNNAWMQAGSIQIGDHLTDKDGKVVVVSSLEWQRGSYQVYNLEVEKYHTYFANGIWVHNEKGGGTTRSVFEDTAYWNPSLKTDNNGTARVSFKLPDNLTTWVITSIGATPDTIVGDGETEIVVTKSVIVRPILPNIFRVGDRIVVSALIQNFTDKNEKFDVNLAFDSGRVDNAGISNLLIFSQETKEIFWNIYPEKEKENAKLIFSVKSPDNKDYADTVVSEIPVKDFGFYEKNVQTLDAPGSLTVKIDPQAVNNKTSVGLSLSPTLTGMILPAMGYLIGYPYGCVEQTTSRFVPALIAKQNPVLFADALKGKNLDEVINAGMNRLVDKQQGDGGWSWWDSGRSRPFVSAYVSEYLLMAKDLKYKVDTYTLEQAQLYFENITQYIKDGNTVSFGQEEQVARSYGLALFGSKKDISLVGQLEGLTPDIIAMAALANVKNGYKNNDANGLNLLASQAQVQGDAVFWRAGSSENFGSVDASTALAVRALIAGNYREDLQAKGIRYLTRNRKSDYWSNTYATAQIVRMISEYSKKSQELTPNYTYSVSLDRKEINQGTITSAKQKEVMVPIPNDQVKPGGSAVTVTKNGNGEIYSTLITNQFNTNREAKAINHGLSISRSYVSDKGLGAPISVGDIVTVNLTVEGLQAEERYAVIEDELPSGMIPINQSLKNQQFNPGDQYVDPYTLYETSYDVTDREITLNGMILSLYKISPGSRVYSYKARVVSEGEFYVPPAKAALMYAPEIYGSSDVQKVAIGKQINRSTPQTVNDLLLKNGLAIISMLALLGAIGGIGYLVFKKVRG